MGLEKKRSCFSHQSTLCSCRPMYFCYVTLWCFQPCPVKRPDCGQSHCFLRIFFSFIVYSLSAELRNSWENPYLPRHSISEDSFCWLLTFSNEMCVKILCCWLWIWAWSISANKIVWLWPRQTDWVSVTYCEFETVIWETFMCFIWRGLWLDIAFAKEY